MREIWNRFWWLTETHPVTAQTAIYSFARDRFADGELDAARKAGPQPLPDAVPEPDSVS